MDACALTIHEAGQRLRAGDLSSVELTRSLLQRVDRLNPRVKAYLRVEPESALAQAGAADARFAAWRRDGGDAPPRLMGIPLAVKDVLCAKGIPTTCGSRILENFVPPYDAAVVERFRAQGAVILGKTNTDEFAMGSSTENSAYFTTRNPWDESRVPGGSSGGSAAAVAADMAMGAVGSDTGGSVRQPASLCGVVGLKPTYGRVSRWGLVAFASSLDQVGPLAKDVRDCAILLEAIAGHDPRDSTSVDAPVPDYVNSIAGGIRGLRVGVPREYFIPGMEPGVERAVRAALAKLEELGAALVEVSLPHTEHALAVYYLIAPAEASANLARYDGVKYGLSVRDAGDVWEMYRQTRGRGFGAEVKRRIMLGTYALSAGYYDAYYVRAQKVRALIKRDFDRAFEQVDVIACPVSPTVAFKIGERADDPLQMYLSDVFTLACSLAGICGISVPCGFSDGLPVGLQIIGNVFDEPAVLRAAHAYEQAADWRGRRREAFAHGGA